MKRYITRDTETYFAFNVWNVESAKAVIDAAAKLGRNVILQTSARVFVMLDKAEFRDYIKSYAAHLGVAVYLHLDHCRDIEIIKKAIEKKWDSVMLDASDCSLEDNIEQTKKVSDLAHAQGILVEAEIGQVRKTSDFVNVAEADTASLDEIKRFLLAVDIDLFAAAIGTAHGLYHGTPRIHYDLLKAIGQMTDVPFVLHGGTGLSDETIQEILSYPQVKKINISTEVKQSYRKAILDCQAKGMFAEDGFEAVMIEHCIHEKIMDMVCKKMGLL